MNTTHSILDHGYLKVIETWGADERIIEAARMSTDKGFQGWGPVHDITCGMHPDFAILCVLQEDALDYTCTCDPKPGDEKLLKYLYTHGHMTPFEMAGAVIEVQAPIFVFREWHRHRTQSYNELSARYTPIPDVNYVPTIDRCLVVNGANKQAGVIAGANALTHQSVLEWLDELASVYAHAEQVYQSGLQRGIPKELARCPVPVGRYSRMRVSANLRNWMGFLTLRTDETAQWEIRQFANQLATALSESFPRSMSLWSK